MGVGWVAEVIVWSLNLPQIYVLPINIINILTGVFQFIALLQRRKVRHLLKNKFRPMLTIFRRGQFTIAKSSVSGPTVQREAYQPQSRSNSTSSTSGRNTVYMTQISRETCLEEIDLSK